MELSSWFSVRTVKRYTEYLFAGSDIFTVTQRGFTDASPGYRPVYEVRVRRSSRYTDDLCCHLRQNNRIRRTSIYSSWLHSTAFITYTCRFTGTRKKTICKTLRWTNSTTRTNNFEASRRCNIISLKVKKPQGKYAHLGRRDDRARQ